MTASSKFCKSQSQLRWRYCTVLYYVISSFIFCDGGTLSSPVLYSAMEVLFHQLFCILRWRYSFISSFFFCDGSFLSSAVLYSAMEVLFDRLFCILLWRYSFISRFLFWPILHMSVHLLLDLGTLPNLYIFSIKFQ